MNKFNKKAISNLEGKVARGEYSEAELSERMPDGANAGELQDLNPPEVQKDVPSFKCLANP